MERGRFIAFVSGGNLSKSSQNCLNNYRNKIAQNYDKEQKNKIKTFIKTLKTEKKIDVLELNRILSILIN